MSSETTPRHARPAPPRMADPFDGVLVLDKPSGPTSHDMVDRVRRLFGLRKVGHGGTLDPMATGVLVMLLGRATKMSSLFLGSDKTYEGTINLGISTDSHDAVGTITAEKEWRGITREQLEAVMATFHGDMMQTPPMVSAIKINGVPLYKHARKGETVAREARLIHIYAFTLTRFSPPDADFVLRCTKGTYVRKICADIGDALGCGAHLSSLRRTQSGSITIDQAVTAAQLSTFSREDLMRHLLPAAQFAAARHSAREPQSP